MGRKAQQATTVKARTPIPTVASLRVSPERIERMWQMTARQRVEAAQQGQFTLGEMLQWAARRAHEVPLVNNEFFFITASSADDEAAAAAADTRPSAQAFWDGEYTPLPDTRDASRAPLFAAASDMSSEGSR